VPYLISKIVDDRSTLVIVQRIQRINTIWRLLIEQINILDTMAPTDFLDFRNYLSTSSGFESLQFRLFENKLGLSEVNSLLKLNSDFFNLKHFYVIC
jgi:tryptophan 2,3-dioxygenase